MQYAAEPLNAPFDGSFDRSPAFCDGQALSGMPSDIELMERAAAGDAEAFAAIYDRHAGTLLAVAQRLLSRSDEALDLLHDVFLEAWQRVREYDASRSAPRTWLIIRLRSRALDRRARAARGVSVAEQLEAMPRAASVFGERQLEVARALRELDDDVRSVLELTYFEGLTALEISERDGSPVGTVRSRLARGLEQLRKNLGTLGSGG
jgi:RNA polymerase sigma-70 factor (ECF subfamily)